MRVSFDFDPITKKVTNVECVENTPTKVIKSVKVKKQNNKVILVGNSLKLNQEVLDLLKVTVGDRICVNFTNTSPVLVSDGGCMGNLITKSKTVSVKGPTGTKLASYGTEFFYTLDGEGFLFLNTNEIVDKQIKKSELDNQVFTSSVPDAVEVDFTIEL